MSQSTNAIHDQIERLSRARLTLQHVGSISFFTLFFAVTFAAPLVSENNVPGDVGDARFNIYVLEHVYQWLTGHSVKLFSAPFFYPYPYTLLFSDTHFGTSFIYAIFRLLGFSEYRSFAMWFLTGYFLTLWASYFVLTRSGFGSLSAGAGAAMFAFSLPSIAQISHAQLVYRVCIPFAIFYMWRMLRRHDPFSGLAALCWLFAQLLMSIYLGMFLAMLMGTFVISYLWLGRQNPLRFGLQLYANLRVGAERIRPRQIALIVVVIFLASGSLALLAGYKYVSWLYDLRRDWSEVTAFLPRPESYFIADRLPYWSELPFLSALEIPARHEHNMFVGVGAFVLFIIGFAGLFANRGAALNKDFVRTSLLALFGLVLLVTSVKDYTFYWIMYLLPGFNSIRAIGRIGLVMAFASAIVGAAGVMYLFQARSVLPRVLAVVLVGLFLWETVVARRNTDKFDGRADQERIDAIVVTAKAVAGAIDRPILHLVGDVEAPPWVPHLDAMLAAQRLGWPTVEGYSGFLLINPFGTPMCSTALQQYMQFLDWSVNKGRLADVTQWEWFPQEFLKRTVVVGARKCPPLVPE